MNGKWKLSDCIVTEEIDTLCVWYENGTHQHICINNDIEILRNELDRIEADGETITYDWEDGIGNTVCIENGRE